MRLKRVLFESNLSLEETREQFKTIRLFSSLRLFDNFSQNHDPFIPFGADPLDELEGGD